MHRHTVPFSVYGHVQLTRTEWHVTNLPWHGGIESVAERPFSPVWGIPALVPSSAYGSVGKLDVQRVSMWMRGLLTPRLTGKPSDRSVAGTNVLFSNFCLLAVCRKKKKEIWAYFDPNDVYWACILSIDIEVVCRSCLSLLLDPIKLFSGEVGGTRATFWNPVQ